VALLRRFITLGTVALIVAAVVTQWQRVRELGRQVLSRRREQISISMEENKSLARRSWEIVSQRDLVPLEDVYAADLVWHEPDQDVQGLEEAKQFYSTNLSAFPDLNATVEDVIAEGDKVVTRWTMRGTHRGETEEFGLPTNRQVEIKGLTMHRIEGGKIVEEWEGYDNLGFMQRLGLVPKP
jgi:steroid delta-isomerase-like uncharacterized protein